MHGGMLPPGGRPVHAIPALIRLRDAIAFSWNTHLVRIQAKLRTESLWLANERSAMYINEQRDTGGPEGADFERWGLVSGSAAACTVRPSGWTSLSCPKKTSRRRNVPFLPAAWVWLNVLGLGAV